MQLGSLRSVLDKAKVLALTATATKKAQKQIISALCMVNPKTVAESPDRYDKKRLLVYRKFMILYLNF